MKTLVGFSAWCLFWQHGPNITENHMMTSSNGNIFRVTGPLCGEFGEFPAQRSVPRSFDVFFDLRLNKRLRKQSWGRWFETPLRSLLRHCSGHQSVHSARVFISNIYRKSCIELLCLTTSRSNNVLLAHGLLIRYQSRTCRDACWDLTYLVRDPCWK